jgi:hypothetical protein
VKSSMTSQLRISGANLLVHSAKSRVDRWFPFSLVIVPGGSSRWAVERGYGRRLVPPPRVPAVLYPPPEGVVEVEVSEDQVFPGRFKCIPEVWERVIPFACCETGRRFTIDAMNSKGVI